MHVVERVLWSVAAAASVVLAACALWIAWHDAEQVHEAACAQRAYYLHQAEQTRAFLKLSPEQRRAKYGSIGDIPVAVLRTSLAHYEAQLRVTDSLGCS